MKTVFANSLEYMIDSAVFNEQEHPRGGQENAGQFTAKVGSGESGGSEKGESGKHEDEGGVEAPAAKGSKQAHLREYTSREEWPEHIKKLVIPPAWTKVKVSDSPDADLLAIGKDAKGRDQYVYSEKFQKSQAALKFARIESLRKDKSMIDGQLADALKSGDQNTRDHAECAVLIMKMGVRPGSDTDTGADKKAYGATTLEGKHVVEDGGQVFLRFVGKKGVSLNLPVADKSLASNLAKRAKKAGPDGKLFGNVRDGSLLDFVHTLDHGGYKTKDFRTLLANDMALAEMRNVKPPKDMKEYKAAVKAVATSVSSRLGNTPTVALQSYIHPGVFSPWQGAAAVEPAKGSAKASAKGAKKTAAKGSAKAKASGELSGAAKAWASRRAKAQEANNAAAA